MGRAIGRPILLGVAWACLLAGACARSRPPPWKPLDASALARPLTLAQAIQLAHSNDVRQAEWKARMGAAKAEIATAKAIPNPTVSLIWEDIGLKELAGKSLATSTREVSWNPLFWWTRGKKVAAARAARSGEEAAIRKDKRELDQQIGEAYFNLAAGSREMAAQEDLHRIASDSLRMANTEHDLNLLSDFELDQARAEELQAASAWDEAQSTLQADEMAFAFALGVDRPAYARVVDEESVAPTWLDDAPTMGTVPEALLEASLKGNPEWEAARAARLAAEKQVGAEKRGAIPLADVGAMTGWKKAPEGNSRSRSIDFPLPIFNWNQGGIKAAKARLLDAQAQEEKIRRAAVAELALAWGEYQASRQRWERYSRPFAAIATRNDRAATRLFEAGETEFAELLRVRRDSRQARLDEIEDWKKLATARWKVLCLTGGAVPAEPISRGQSAPAPKPADSPHVMSLD